MPEDNLEFYRSTTEYGVNSLFSLNLLLSVAAFNIFLIYGWYLLRKAKKFSVPLLLWHRVYGNLEAMSISGETEANRKNAFTAKQGMKYSAAYMIINALLGAIYKYFSS